MESMRDAFWNRLYHLAKSDKDIIVLAADMGAPALDKFRNDLPEQFINVGIAEQNTISLAAGLAKEGKKVFAYAIAPFITLRCFEQIRVTIACMKLPVTLVGVGAGFSYDDSGPTHHAVEDISVIRSLPGMVIHNASDSVMAAELANLSCKLSVPNYVRLDRKILPSIYKDQIDLSAGLNILQDNGKLCLIATGNMVDQALQVGKRIGARLIDLYTIPTPSASLRSALEGVERIVTLEEHCLAGGMGSMICEFLQDNSLSIPVKRLGLNFSSGYCYRYGGRENMQKLYGLDVEAICQAIGI